jgi:SNF2 family DNA or RNA helicase
MSDFLFVIFCRRKGRSMWYTLDFPYNEGLIDKIRGFDREDRKFDGLNKVWEVKVAVLYELIKSHAGSDVVFFDFNTDKEKNDFKSLAKKYLEEKKKIGDKIKDLAAKKKKWVEFKEYLEKSYEKYSDGIHEKLKKGIQLYPHQIMATTFINEIGSGLISHDMGLGKTSVSIAISEINDFEKVFVITPNSLKFNYFYEVEKFTNSKAHVVGWRKNKHSINEAKYVIVNYEFFNTGKSDRFKQKWNSLGIDKIDYLVLDECHRTKNTGSNTYKNIKKTFTKNIFRNKEEKKIFLSGTPAPNRAYELYSVLNQISPIDFPTKTNFYEYYCGMTYDVMGGWGYVVDQEQTKFEELYQKISPYTHRKRKKDVAINLPDKTYQRVILEMSGSEEKSYSDVENNVVDGLATYQPGQHLTIMGKLRQFLSDVKINHIYGLVRDIIDNTDEKIVVVDVFKNSLYKLKEKLGDDAELHTGDQSVEERSNIVTAFQDPKSRVRVFLGSIQTCQYGLTLTAASKMFILTLPYTPGDYDQVSDRLHRIGQKNAVNIYVPTFPDTIDDYTYSLIESKREELATVIDNEKHKDMTSVSVFGDLVKQLLAKHGRDIQTQHKSTQ